MVAAGPGDRKEQIVSAAIARLFAVGFEGLRLGDVAKDVGISNATLIHHFASKAALINAVVERFTQQFETVASGVRADGSPREKLVAHMRSSVDLMRTHPEMFVVLNEIMIRAQRDAEIARQLSVPLKAWSDHIVSLLLTASDAADPVVRGRAEVVATACMAQLLGLGLLMGSTDQAASPFEAMRARAASWAMAALSDRAEDAP